ncbi:leucine-rich repeat-containing protein 45-like isoform X2 [Centruroides sculpturatus]|uniref:leucine-rich repeat-containing protein 45-like isoform X2 n=1 Tax=Centruroides sculpturatus TaxID=218467 RepID=UPI000C6E3785|nr:leucine-rich repeat-containing protein 45-like isoform X2 [Centruroides sculpturatus]
MDDFKELFKQLCQKHKVLRQDFVLDYLKCVEDDRISLDLSSCNLSVSICIVLGKVLEQNATVTDLYFCNCMLPYKGLKAILDGLCINKAVRFLNLKGNNLRGKSADDIGKLLRDNNVLYRLSLEWNSLGKCHDSFTLFCSGLATNKTLKILDLRNNEINNEGAVALASALSKNISLQSLDVRWNQINNLGADSLLSVLKQYNKTLLNLDLSGNPDMANSILETIAAVLTNNCTLQLLEEDELRRKMLMMDKSRTTNINVQNVKQHVTYLSSSLEKDFQWKCL